MSEALALPLDDTPSAHILDVLLGEPITTDATADRSRPRVLEVAQVFGDAVLDLKHFARGRAVALGATLDKKLGGARLREDFFVPTTLLPSSSWSLFEPQGEGWACVVDPSWDGFVDGPHGRRSFAALAAMVAPGADGMLRLPIADDERAVIEVGTSIFVARAVFPSRRVPIIGAASIDYPLLGIAGFIGFVSMMLGVAFSQLPPPPQASTMAKIDDIVTLLPQRPEPAKPAAGPSGERAKGPEGKRGDPDPSKVALRLDRRPTDTEVARNAGVLGALENDADLNSMLGDSALNAQLLSGVGSLIAGRATQIGAGGLGARSGGFGGGGTAEGMGGLGGIGKERGGGCAGALCGGDGHPGGGKADGEIRVDSGTVVLGALDKSQIDAVIKRNLNQIRYCYQRELTKSPSLSGKVNVKFVIARDGSVSSATTKTSTLANPAVESCINSRFMRFTFPEPRGGGIVVVSYPFLFAPG